jgi:hypothetical protein
VASVCILVVGFIHTVLHNASQILILIFLMPAVKTLPFNIGGELGFV